MYSKVIAFVIAVSLGFVSSGTLAADKVAKPDVVGQHMIAEATLTAHFVAAALKAGMSRDEINATLAEVAANTVITEFWVSDHNGQVVFSNVDGVSFSFPTDTGAGNQAAPFAALLDGSAQVVIQDSQPRELDNAVYRYIGVAGVDQRRIVQVGISAKDMESD